MKVYFGCSITGGRDHAHLYQDIADAIKGTGANLLSELFASTSVDAKKGIGVKKDMSKRDIWEWDLNWVREADIVIAEVTQPSLGVGYEIAKAEEWGKPVLALFYEPSGNRLSSMIEGSDFVETVYYSNKDEAEQAVKDFISEHR